MSWVIEVERDSKTNTVLGTVREYVYRVDSDGWTYNYPRATRYPTRRDAHEALKSVVKEWPKAKIVEDWRD